MNQTVYLIGFQNLFQMIYANFIRDDLQWDHLQAEEKRFVTAVKTCLIAADVAGSALPQKIVDQKERSDWIQRNFTFKPSADEITRMIAKRIECNLAELENKLRDFQKEVARSGRSDLVEAAVVLEKPAAYNWARVHCPGKRLYICYPDRYGYGRFQRLPV